MAVIKYTDEEETPTDTTVEPDPTEPTNPDDQGGGEGGGTDPNE
jgi:hypothetical protein